MKQIIAGIILGSIFTVLFFLWQPILETKSKNIKKPLYWVAPMDPDFRREEPGKSPMGMDLVPYYGDKSEEKRGKGVVAINSQMVNNLGVKVATVTKNKLQHTINAVGYVNYDEDYLLHVHPRVSGWIEKLYVDAEGDHVEKGQALYEIYSPMLINAQGELVLAIERNNQRLINAAKERLLSLQFPEAAIQALLKTRNIKQSTTFYAPQSGYIDQLNVRQGFFVEPGKTLMQIAQLDQVWIRAEIEERFIRHLSTGLSVSIKTEAFPDKQWLGEIDHIHPSLSLSNRTSIVRMHLDNHDQVLKPNMFVKVSIQEPSEQAKLLVPVSAVIRLGEVDRVVMALGDGQFKSVEVELGQADKYFFEIISGLEAGDQVVTSAQFLLDSESSKTSDFLRMDHYNITQQAVTTGRIMAIDQKNNALTIDRDAISKWGRTAARIDFFVKESITLDPLSVGDEVSFIFVIDQDQFIITDVNKVATVESSEELQ